MPKTPKTKPLAALVPSSDRVAEQQRDGTYHGDEDQIADVERYCKARRQPKEDQWTRRPDSSNSSSWNPAKRRASPTETRAGPAARTTRDLAADELEQRAKEALARGHRGALRRAGAALGERPLRAPRRPPGDGRGRQGLGDRARDVRREPAGRPGRLVQEAVRRGARPRLPLAHLEGAARARPDRHLQPLALRGGRRAEGASRVARAAAPPARRARRARSGRSATRTSTPSSVTSTATGRRS